ncbi:MAG: hypothetical protein JOY85_21340 [Acidobacteriaceae bacterium]|nr:hypothetical protein [Acidobacteriaceae bacterium]
MRIEQYLSTAQFLSTIKSLEQPRVEVAYVWIKNHAQVVERAFKRSQRCRAAVLKHFFFGAAHNFEHCSSPVFLLLVRRRRAVVGLEFGAGAPFGEGLHGGYDVVALAPTAAQLFQETVVRYAI